MRPRATSPLAFILAAAFVACAAPTPPPAPAGGARTSPPRLAVSGDPAWTGAGPGDDVVAWANGVPIPASRLRRALAEAGRGADPRVVLDAVIASELVAQQAVERDPGLSTPSPLAWERALVATLLERRFGRMTPADFPRSEVELLWNHPQVRARYDHLAAYDVMDYQWICCNGWPNDCGRPEAQQCFVEGQVAMARVYAEVSARKPEVEDIPLIVQDLQGLAPRLSYQEYQFAYDTKERVQKGRSLFDDAVVGATVATAVGSFSPPVRSKFGWHVLYVRNYTPEEHRDLSDPIVVQQIAEYFLPRHQRKAFFELLATLAAPTSLPSVAAFFKGRDTPLPRYDVALFADALREAVAADAARRDEEPL